jgi:hypothetical protein
VAAVQTGIAVIRASRYNSALWLTVPIRSGSLLAGFERSPARELSFTTRPRFKRKGK